MAASKLTGSTDNNTITHLDILYKGTRFSYRCHRWWRYEQIEAIHEEDAGVGGIRGSSSVGSNSSSVVIENPSINSIELLISTYTLGIREKVFPSCVREPNLSSIHPQASQTNQWRIKNRVNPQIRLHTDVYIPPSNSNPSSLQPDRSTPPWNWVSTAALGLRFFFCLATNRRRCWKAVVRDEIITAHVEFRGDILNGGSTYIGSGLYVSSREELSNS